MPVFEMTKREIVPLGETSFEALGLKERGDLQRLLRDRIEVVSDDTLVLTEEFGDWEDSRRRIDLLGLDKSANLVVIELKRSEDRGSTELQAIRYAAMISAMTFDQVVMVHQDYLKKRGQEQEARSAILDFLDWDEPLVAEFAQSVRVVLVADGFSKELTTSVIWLNQHDLDVRCVRVKPYLLEGRLLVDVQQTIPLPEAAEYQVRIKNKTQAERAATNNQRDHTKYIVRLGTFQTRALPKRRAIFTIVKHLTEQGVSPEDVSKSLPDRQRNWLWIDGEADAATFRARAAVKMQDAGKSFEERRWFCDDGELMRVNGRTYAFSNQWGSGKAEFANLLSGLIATHPSIEMSFEEVD